MAGEQNTIRVGAAAIIEDNKGKILMGKRNVFPKGMWVFPGGGINFGERAEDAVKREIREETGLNVSDAKFFTVYEMIVPENKVHRVIFYFKAKAKDTKKIKPSTDIEELKWMELDEIARLDNLGHATLPVLKIAGYLK